MFLKRVEANPNYNDAQKYVTDCNITLKYFFAYF